MSDDDTRRRVEPGRYYAGNDTRVGPEVPAGAPDVILCRRLDDFPDGCAPAGAAIVRCRDCGQLVATNPASFPTVPRVCMQCRSVEPLPFDE